MGWEEATALVTLFVAAFGAATVLPFQSEVVFGAMLAGGVSSVWALFIVASIGNTLGSVVNYVLGRFLERFRDARWFPATETQLDRASRWYQRYGVWTLLLSWAPFADPLTIVAGVLRTPFWLFFTLVAIAKTGRYAALIWFCDALAFCAPPG